MNLTNGDALNPVTGAWDPATTINWSSDNAGTTYSTWNNGGSTIANVGATNVGQTLTIPNGTAINLGGITTYVHSGVGSGNLSLSSAGGSSLVFAANSVIDVATGTTLSQSNGGGDAFRWIASAGGLIKSGGGLMNITSFSGGTNFGSVFRIDAGIFRFNGNNATGGTIIQLNGANAAFETAQTTSASGRAGVPWAGVTGTQGVVRSTSVNPTSITTYVLRIQPTAGGTTIEVPIEDASLNSRLALIKSGAEPLTISNANNTFSGGLYIDAGQVNATTAGSVKAPVLVSTSGTVFNPTIAGTLGSIGSVTVLSGGRLNADNLTVDELRRVSLHAGGAAIYGDASAIPGADIVPLQWHRGAVLGAVALDNAFLQRIDPTFSGTIALAGNNSANLDFNTASGGILPSAFLGAVGSSTYSGTLTPHGTTYRLGGGGGTLILDQSNALTGTRSLIIGDSVVPIAAAVANSSLGTVRLTAANDLVGSLTINQRSVFELSGANGTLTGVTNITVNRNSELRLIDASTASNNNRIGDTTSIHLNGGDLTWTGTRGTTERVGALSITGRGRILGPSGAVAGSGTAVLNFSGLTRSSGDSTAQFTVGSNSRIEFATTPSLTNGIIGGWALFANNNFAGMSGNALVSVAGTTFTDTTEFGALIDTDNAWRNWGSTTTDLAINGRTIHSLALTASGGRTVTLTGNLVVSSGGMILEVNGGLFTGGTITAGAGSQVGGMGPYHLYLNNPTRSFAVASQITDNGINAVRVVKTGASLTLNGANSYTGGTVINSGTVGWSGSSTSTPFGTGEIILNGAGALLNHTQAATVLGIGNAITVNANATISGSSTAGGDLTINGPITLNLGSELSLTGGSVMNLGNAITGSGSLRIARSGGMVLSGSTANTFDGDVYFASTQTLTLDKTTGVNAIPNNLWLGNASASGTAIVILNASEQISDSGVAHFVTGGAGGAVGTGILRLNGFNETLGGIQSFDGNGIIENNQASTASMLTLGVGDGQTYSFGGVIRNRATAGGGALALVIDNHDNGTQILAGANTYSGGTTVETGWLVVNNTTGSGTGSGSVTIQNDGVLSGVGIISGNTLIEGTHAPGNSPGVQTFVNDLDYSSAVVVWELIANSVGGRGTNFDGIDVGGDLTFTGSNTLELIFDLADSTVNWNDSFWQGNQSWLLYDVIGATSDLTNLMVTADNWLDGSGNAFNTLLNGSSFNLSLTGQSVYLNYAFNVIPEPGRFLLIGLGLTGLILRRRRV